MQDNREHAAHSGTGAGAEPAAAVRDERFEIRGKLGAGGMGDVYRAYDRARQIEVALKALRRVNPRLLFNFKNEFRSLAHLTHRNLVTLYELRSADGEWFFTMELIRGCTFIEHVRSTAPLPDQTSDVLTFGGDGAPTQTIAGAVARPVAAMDTVLSNHPSVRNQSATHRYRSASDPAGASTGSKDPLLDPRRQALMAGSVREDALRDALAQLVDAVCALHRAGKLHRDLKQSNVMVEDDGARVVVCDFGLVTDVSGGGDQGGERRLAGTPAYAPEQSVGRELAPASDWYSVGVMLHEALTGRHPFHGSLHQILSRKQAEDAAPCRNWVDSLPEELSDLADLCDELLRRDPARRPTGEQILARLGLDVPAAFSSVTTDPGSAPFVGRASELTELWRSLARVRAGAAAAVFVHAPSGMGKSALVRRFLSTVRRAEPGAAILEGRCYERESVPYKALDSVIDAMSATLALADDDEVASLIPDDVGSLARLFPVLNRVPAVAAAAGALPADTQELRQQAFGALRELVGRIAARQLTILSIDDLQWGDIDSAAFLVDLIHHPTPPPLLFVGTYRSDEADSSPLVRALLNRGGVDADVGDVRLVELGALSAAESRQLARRIVEGGAAAGAAGPEALLEAIERDTDGNPLFVTEMALAAGDTGGAFGGGGDDDASASLDGLLAQRIGRLPPAARALLTAAAVAGRPTPTGLLAGVAKVDDVLAAVAVLKVGNLIRVRSAGGDDEVETYHDRIRETAAAELSDAERRSYHLRLARAYETSGATDPQSLVDHWMGAGDDRRAGEYAVRAGQQAAEAAAFAQAARYYGLALRLCDLERDRARELEVLRAHALVNAGDLLGGADLYLQAAADSDPGAAVDLKRLAMMHLLRGGRLEEGLELAEEVLSVVGLSLPKSRFSALLSVIYRKIVLALGGSRLGSSKREPPGEDSRWRMDVCWSAQTGVAMVNPLYGVALQLRYIQSARRYDDPYRASLALGAELGFVSMVGESQRERVATISRQAIELAEQSGNPHGRGIALGMSGIACFLTGQWQRAAELTGQGEQILLHECVGARYDSDIARIYRLASLYSAGHVREVTRAVPLLLREAMELGNEYLANALRAWRTNEVWLVMDEPEQARRHLAAAAETAATDDRAFHLHHFYSWRSECQLALYAGDADEAWERVEEGWQRLSRSMLLRIESVRIESQYLRGRAAVAMAARHGERRSEFARVAAKCARKLEGSGASWGIPIANLVRGCIAAVGGDREHAAELFARAVEGFEAVEMPLFVAAARARLAGLLSPAEGAAHARAARDWMDREAARNPARLLDMMAPGPRAAAPSLSAAPGETTLPG